MAVDGFPTNTIKGVMTMLLSFIKHNHPEYLVVAFDTDAPTFRHEVYPEYKQGRTKYEDLEKQKPAVKEMVRLLGIPTIEKEGFEADDVLATIARKCSQRGLKVLISTGDKDLMQVVNDRVSLFCPRQQLLIREAEVYQKFGVAPKTVPDVLGLAGDDTDNIPGVPGVGDKTAMKLMKEFGSMEELYHRIGEVKGKLKDNLWENSEQAFLSQFLATAVEDVPIEISMNGMRLGRPDERLPAFKARYGLN